MSNVVDIFISHATRDHHLVRELVKLIEGGIGIRKGRQFIPLIVETIDVNDLKGALFGTQVLRMDRTNDLDKMYEVIGRVATPAAAVTRWNERKEDFLGRVKEILASLPPSNPRRKRKQCISLLNETNPKKT
jgi:hypothetical protein